MKLLSRFFLFLAVFFFCKLSAANECGVEVRFLQSLTNVVPGCVTTLQAEVVNRGCCQSVLVSHLDLPPLWEVVTMNDLLIHVNVGQCAIQTLMIKVPEHAEPGEYRIAYEVWGRNNMNIYDRDNCSVVIGKVREIEDILSVEMTSPQLSEVDSGELVFVSAMVKNLGSQLFEDRTMILLPNGWSCFPAESVDLCLEPDESKVLIFGVKVPCNALAGEHVVGFYVEGFPDIKRSVLVKVIPKIEVKAAVKGLSDIFTLNQQVQLYMSYTNEGNTPLKVALETSSSPPCSLSCSEEPFIIPPQETVEIPIVFSPETCSTAEYSQFVLVKLIDVESGEQLYQNPMSLRFVAPGTLIDDPYVRIPGHFRMLALGDRYKNVLAAEYAGGGLIDPEKNRYFDFFIRLPTDPNYVLYNIDQCIYGELYDDEWDFCVGDTVYELSPLTQRYRYGRGAGIEHFGEEWNVGVHYTQNTLESSCNPRETCAYLEYRPSDIWGIAANYLHVVESEIPTSNMVTIQSNLEFPENVVTEVEVGQNFIPKKEHRDNKAYRVAVDGKVFEDTWFDIEKVYAGPEFYGYYNHIHFLTGSLDCPVYNRVRFNFNMNRFVQNFNPCAEEEAEAIIPRQRQYSASFTYRISQGCSFAVNGMTLRARDLGDTDQYNFFQKWAGVSLFLTSWGYNFNGSISYGRQKDYLKHEEGEFLQRYYVYISKDFTPNLSASIFYDGGNINYYDAGPWRSSYGGAINYRFSPTGYIEFFGQKVNDNIDMVDMTQISCNFSYIFRNLHRLQATLQYYHYRSHYPNDTTFLVSYTIPFNIPIGRRQDIGEVRGCLFELSSGDPIEGALIGCAGSHVTTGPDGAFLFAGLEKGECTPAVKMLPDDYIETTLEQLTVDVPGGAGVTVYIPVVHSCSIAGEVKLYGYKDLFAVMMNPDNAEMVLLEGLSGIKVGIERIGASEVYLATTNSNGCFKFPKIRPGNWHIKVYTDSLTELQEIQMNDLILELKPGEQRMIDFDVKPKSLEVYKLEAD